MMMTTYAWQHHFNYANYIKPKHDLIMSRRDPTADMLKHIFLL
jgi:hypothetical protein